MKQAGLRRRLPSEGGRVSVKAPTWRAWVSAIAVLLVGGASYRVAMSHLGPLMTARIVLPVPLENFPRKIGRWSGEDRPLSLAVERIAGNDDYFNRLYIDHVTREAANLYVAYSGRPRTMLGHRPRLCYTGAGWMVDSTVRDELSLPGGGKLPFLVNRFHMPPPRSEQIVVLNYYVLNGVPTSDADSFAGIGWRLPNIAGDPAWYVAQVQISSTSEGAVRRLAAESAEALLDILPDSEGNVRAADVPRDAQTVQGKPGEGQS